MNQKKDRSVISLILSALSLMVGVVWAGATVIIMGSMGTDVPAWRLGMLIAFSPLFLFLGIRGLLRYRSQRMAKGGNSRYSGIRNRIWRVSSRMVALRGWPLDWK